MEWEGKGRMGATEILTEKESIMIEKVSENEEGKNKYHAWNWEEAERKKNRNNSRKIKEEVKENLWKLDIWGRENDREETKRKKNHPSNFEKADRMNKGN